MVANLARDWGLPEYTRGLATAATLQTFHFPARVGFTGRHRGEIRTHWALIARCCLVGTPQGVHAAGAPKPQSRQRRGG